MSLIELLLLSLGLAADAFSVSVCKGLASKKAGIAQMICAGLWFGVFQALMPLIGWFLGSTCRSLIENIDHWIAFVLLAAIGLNMIREAFFSKDEDLNGSFSPKIMFLLAVATSIDALAVGITMGLIIDAFTNMLYAAGVIGLVTFILSAVGVKTGSLFGAKFGKSAQVTGGICLILIGLKILLEHLGILG